MSASVWSHVQDIEELGNISGQKSETLWSSVSSSEFKSCNKIKLNWNKKLPSLIFLTKNQVLYRWSLRI